MDGAGEEQRPEQRAAGGLGMGCGKDMDEGCRLALMVGGRHPAMSLMSSPRGG